MNTESQKSQRRRCLSEPTPTSFLPGDLIIEIISWLTVKPLMKMKCVSKSFKTLISNPNFVKLHLNRSSRNRLSYLVSYKDDSKKDDYSFAPFSIVDLIENPSIAMLDDPPPNYCLIDKDCRKVVGSCNGLVCLLGSSEHLTWFRLWNPATRTISDKLGFLPNMYRYKLIYWKFTFGYDNSTDTYKVVALRAVNDALTTEMRVLSFGDNIWRGIPSFPARPFLLLTNSEASRRFSVHLNGTFNWLAIASGRLLVIISLDLSTETYKIMHVPQMPMEKLPRICVMTINGEDHLYLYYDEKKDFIIWKMTKFGDDNSWTRKHVLNSRDFFSRLHFYQNGSTRIMVFLQVGGALLVHSLRTGTILKNI